MAGRNVAKRPTPFNRANAAPAQAIKTTLADRLLIGMATSGIGRSAAKLAERLEVSRQTAGRWLNGTTESIESHTLMRAAGLFGFCPVWLATGDGSPTPMERVTADESVLLQAFRKMSPAEQNNLLDVMNTRVRHVMQRRGGDAELEE